MVRGVPVLPKSFTLDFKVITDNIKSGVVGVIMHQPVDDELDLVAEFERLVALGDEEDKKVTNPRNGDHVIYAGKHKARVVRVLSDGRVRIKYDDSSLIPPKQNVPIEYLEKSGEPRVINPNYYCPKCDVEWKESQGFHLDVYYDCPKCGMKKEDALKSKGVTLTTPGGLKTRIPGSY